MLKAKDEGHAMHTENVYMISKAALITNQSDQHYAKEVS